MNPAKPVTQEPASKRPPVAMCLWFALLAVALFVLAGCAPAHLSGSGKPAPAPEGYTQLCADTPAHPLCGARK